MNTFDERFDILNDCNIEILANRMNKPEQLELPPVHL